MIRIVRSAVLLFVFSILLLPPATAKEGTVYTLGVVPSLPPVASHTRWAPFVERLSRETGLALRLKVYETMSDFERDIVSAEAPDFIFSNALQFMVAYKAQGYLPLVRGNKMVRGVVFVRMASPVKTTDDLSGKRIAFVGAKSL